MKRLSALLIIVCAITMGFTNLQALVINFDDLESPGSNITTMQTYSGQGFLINDTVNSTISFATPQQSNSLYFGSANLITNFRDAWAILSSQAQELFSLNSIDLHALSEATNVTFYAYDINGTQVASQNCVLNDASGWYTFSFGTGFQNISSVKWQQLEASHSFDNIVINSADVSGSLTIENMNPAPNATQVPLDTNIVFHLKDSSADIMKSSIDVSVQREGDAQATLVIDNGTPATGASMVADDDAHPRDITVSYDAPDDDAHRFTYNQKITVRVHAENALSDGLDYEYYFITVDMMKPANVRVNSTTAGDQINPAMVMDNSGKEVYVVWQDENNDIWFGYSDDRGASFTPQLKVNPNGAGINTNPSLAVDQPGDVYVIWEHKKNDQSTSDLYFARKLKNKTDFESEVIPVDDAQAEVSDQLFPSIQTKSNGMVAIVWANQNGSNKNGVFYARSENQGSSFWNITAADILQVDDGGATLAQYPDIGIDSSGHSKYITWSAVKNNKRNIYFNAFEYDSGDKKDYKQYANDIQVNDTDANTTSCERPRIANRNVGGGSKPNIVVAWENEKNSDVDIYLDKSNNGSLWGTDKMVSEDDTDNAVAQKGPQVGMDANGDVFVAWADQRNGNWDIYVTYSLDGMNNFKSDILLNDDKGISDQQQPSLYLSANGKDFCVTWTDERNGDKDIYFGRNTISENCLETLVDEDVDTTLTATTGVPNTEVVIPKGALQIDTTISIGQVYCPPGFIFGKTCLDKFIHFGPSGTEFKKNVTIRIPYTPAELQEAGLSQGTVLTIYYYNPKMKAWELVPNTVFDSLRQLVSASVDHFSIYALAAADSSGGGGGGGGGCFIATAAYGSADARDVLALQQFRDRYLMASSAGRAFIRFYYRHSPQLAHYIEDKPGLKFAVRLVLKPIVIFMRSRL